MAIPPMAAATGDPTVAELLLAMAETVVATAETVAAVMVAEMRRVAATADIPAHATGAHGAVKNVLIFERSINV